MQENTIRTTFGGWGEGRGGVFLKSPETVSLIDKNV